MLYCIQARLLLLFGCLGFWFAASGQGRIKGIFIVNAVTRVPVSDVFVMDPAGGFRSFSDERGYVDLQSMSSAPGRLLISTIGYESRSVQLSSLAAEAEPLVDLYAKISSLQEVVVNARGSSGIYKSISDLDVHLRPVTNAQEVLRLVPGLFIGQHAGGGKAEQIFLRGFDIDHGTDIRISVDGLPVNMSSHAHGQGYADLHFLIPEFIEKVQFNKGPYYADKGDFATAGSVSFATKDHLDDFVKVEAGQFGTLRTVAGFNLLKKKEDIRSQSFYIGGEAFFSKGYFESPQRFSRYNGIARYHGRIGKSSTLTAMLTAFSSRWDASGQIPLRAVESGQIGFYGAIDDTEGGRTSRYNASVQLLSNTGGGIWSNQLFYSRYLFDLFSNFTFFKVDPVNGDQIRQQEQRDLLGWNSSWRRSTSLAGINGETRAGLQLRYDLVDDVRLSRTRNRYENLSDQALGDATILNAAGYLSQRFILSRKWEATAGARLDHFRHGYQDQLAGDQLSSSSWILSPNLQLDYKPSEGVQLYLYAGRGFHSNDARVVVREGRKALPAALGADLGGIMKLGKKTVLQAALWYLWLDQEFIYVGDEGIVEEGGRTIRKGVDLTLRHEVLTHLYADLDLTIADPRSVGVPKEESYLPLAPRFTSSGGLSYKRSRGWNGSLRYRFMSDRPANESNTTIARGYCIADAVLNYRWEKWEAGVGIQNLFNSRWMETQFETESRLQNEPAPVTEIHFTPGTPFFWKFGITYSF